MEDAVRHLGKLNPLLDSVPQGPRHCSEDNIPRGTCGTSSVEDSEDNIPRRTCGTFSAEGSEDNLPRRTYGTFSAEVGFMVRLK